MKTFFLFLLFLSLMLSSSAQDHFFIKDYLKIAAGENGFKEKMPESAFWGGKVLNIGDLDGDGIAEVLVASSATWGPDWILFLDKKGQVRDQQKLSLSYGPNITVIGDVDGDGVVDLAGGRKNHGEGKSYGGGAFDIIFLRKNGSVKSIQPNNPGEEGFDKQVSAYEGFGSHICGIGDIDGDNIPDLLCQGKYVAPEHEKYRNFSYAASLWLIMLTAEGKVKSYRAIDNQNRDFFPPFFFKLNEAPFSHIFPLGDLDENGVPDAGIICPAEKSIRFLFFEKGGKIKEMERISLSWEQFRPFSIDLNSCSIQLVGDLNRDGRRDLMLCQHDKMEANSMDADIFILYLNQARRPFAIDHLSVASESIRLPLKGGHCLGSSFAALGDIDGDDYPDFAFGAVGERESPHYQFATGALWLIFSTYEAGEAYSGKNK